MLKSRLTLLNRSVKDEHQVTLIIAEESPRQPEVMDLLRQSDAHAQSLYPAESNHLMDLSELEKPSVTFLVARFNGAISGCCALVGGGDVTGEIKRMFQKIG